MATLCDLKRLMYQRRSGIVWETCLLHTNLKVTLVRAQIPSSLDPDSHVLTVGLITSVKDSENKCLPFARNLKRISCTRYHTGKTRTCTKKREKNTNIEECKMSQLKWTLSTEKKKFFHMETIRIFSPVKHCYNPIRIERLQKREGKELIVTFVIVLTRSIMDANFTNKD